MAQGYKTLEGIEDALSRLAQQERDAMHAVEAANAARAERLRQRTLEVRRLAELRARSALADGVIDEADRLDGDVAMILSARQRAVAALEERRQAAVALHKELLAESEAGIAAIERLEEELDRLGEDARRSLDESAAYREALAVRHNLASQTAKAADKAEQAEEDRRRKSAPYEADPLFMYLWRNDYRGKDYRPSRIVRALDDWVAGLVRYNEARANYALLNEIPVRLKAHAERLEADRMRAAAQVEALEASKMAALDNADIIGRIREARARQKEVDARLGAVETEAGALAGELNRYARGEDDAFRQSVEAMAAFLEKSRYERLVEEARRTPDPDDDVVVGRISGIDRDVERLEREAREKARELETFAKRRQELVKVAADFRRKSYHQPGSVFEPDFDLEDLLEDVVKGVLTGAEYWVRTRARQQWKGRSGDPFRRKAGFPPFDFDVFGGSGGGGGGRSRRGSKRGKGGGDFRTGGGF